jgi:hypothetical protein
MFRNFLFLTLPLILCGITFLLYQINAITEENVTPKSLQYPPHPNLIKETALIFDMGEPGIKLTPLGNKKIGSSIVTEFISQTFFDIDNDGFAELVSWPKDLDGFIVIDLNKNGIIDNQTELFGKDVNNENGFIKIARYDSNKDGFISAADKTYDQLKIWQDTNQNGRVNPGELHSLQSLNIDKIDLNFTAPQYLGSANDRVKFISSYSSQTTKRPINEIEIQKSNMVTHYLGNVTLNIATLFLPTLKGFGNLPDLHIAMSQDQVLFEQLKDITYSLSTNTDDRLKNSDLLKSDFEKLLFRWAKCDQIKTDFRGPYVNAQQLIYIEKMTGSPYGETAQYPHSDPPNKVSGLTIDQTFKMFAKPQMAFIINQIIAEKLYDQKPTYNLMSGEMSNGHLSLNGIQYLETLASSLPIDQRKKFWTEMVNIILPVKEKNILEADEISRLNESISKTLPSENLQSIVTNANAS